MASAVDDFYGQLQQLEGESPKTPQAKRYGGSSLLFAAAAAAETPPLSFAGQESPGTPRGSRSPGTPYSIVDAPAFVGEAVEGGSVQRPIAIVTPPRTTPPRPSSPLAEPELPRSTPGGHSGFAEVGVVSHVGAAATGAALKDRFSTLPVVPADPSLEVEVATVQPQTAVKFLNKMALLKSGSLASSLMYRSEAGGRVELSASLGNMFSDLQRAHKLEVGGRVIESAELREVEKLKVGLQHLLGLNDIELAWFLSFGKNYLHQGLEQAVALMLPFTAATLDLGVPGTYESEVGKRFVSIARDGDQIVYTVVSKRRGHTSFNTGDGADAEGDPEKMPVLWEFGVFQEIRVDMCAEEAVVECIGFTGPDQNFLKALCECVISPGITDADAMRLATMLVSAAQARSAEVTAADTDFTAAATEYLASKYSFDDGADERQEKARDAVSEACPSVFATLADRKLTRYMGLPPLCELLPPEKVLDFLIAQDKFRAAPRSGASLRPKTKILEVLFEAAGFTADGLKQVGDTLISLFGEQAKPFAETLPVLYSQGSGGAAVGFKRKLNRSFPRESTIFWGQQMPKAWRDLITQLESASGPGVSLSL